MNWLKVNDASLDKDELDFYSLYAGVKSIDSLLCGENAWQTRAQLLLMEWKITLDDYLEKRLSTPISHHIIHADGYPSLLHGAAFDLVSIIKNMKFALHSFEEIADMLTLKKDAENPAHVKEVVNTIKELSKKDLKTIEEVLLWIVFYPIEKEVLFFYNSLGSATETMHVMAAHYHGLTLNKETPREIRYALSHHPVALVLQRYVRMPEINEACMLRNKLYHEPSAVKLSFDSSNGFDVLLSYNNSTKFILPLMFGAYRSVLSMSLDCVEALVT